MAAEPGRSTSSDADAYPWVEDLDGWWHLRPADDEWVTSSDGPNAQTVCGKAVASVHVSEYRPDPGEQNLCPTCPDGTRQVAVSAVAVFRPQARGGHRCLILRRLLLRFPIRQHRGGCNHPASTSSWTTEAA